MPAPTASSAPGGWPYNLGDGSPAFGQDGTVFFLARDAEGAYQRIAAALDAAGHMKPGWPIAASRDSYFDGLAMGPDGSTYILERGGPAVGNALHRLDATGRELPGWPFKVPSDFACPAGHPFDTDDPRTPAVNDPCYPPGLDVGPNGTAYLIDQRPEGGLIAIDAAGKVMPGWPVSLDDHDWSYEQLGSDGTVFLVRRPIGTPTWDESRGLVDNDAELWAFGPDGKPRSGWPVPVPDIRGLLIGPQGSVVVWSLIDDVGELCPGPRRTLYTVVGADGRTMSGWPRGSTGFASFPVVDADGTVYYVSATGKVYAHNRAGEVKTGWPVAVPGAGNGCGPESPYLAPDGTIYVIGDEVVALSPDGRSRPGWPYRPAGQLTGPCLDSECYGGHGAPAFGGDGTVYLVVYRGDPGDVHANVVAVDRNGHLKPGWPYRAPFDANTVSVGLPSVSADGGVFVQGGYSPRMLLALDTDGRLAR